MTHPSVAHTIAPESSDGLPPLELFSLRRKPPCCRAASFISGAGTAMSPSTGTLQNVPVVRRSPSASPSAPDRLLVLSMLAVILLSPVLDHGDVGKLILTALTFVPVILATIQLSEKKHWLWPSVLLMSIAIASGLASTFVHHRVLETLKWGALAAFFALSVVGIFLNGGHPPAQHAGGVRAPATDPVEHPRERARAIARVLRRIYLVGRHGATLYLRHDPT